jgi:lysophospholipase L1-like esterase
MNITGWHRVEKRLRLAGVVLLAGTLLAGCGGSDSDEDDPMMDGLAGTEGAAEDPLAEFFPDGLHPNSKANSIIAGVFAKQIPAARMQVKVEEADGEGGGADVGGEEAATVHVVCLGDSITARGYPSVLASRTGLNVVSEGVGGETSGRGAARAAGVVSQYDPGYLCILYGANDVIGAKSTPEAVAANIAAIVAAAQANGTVPIVGTLTPLSGSRAQYADDARAVSSAIRAMAAQTGARLADLEKAF